MTAQGKYGHVYEVDLVRNVRSTKSKSSASDRYDLREYRQPSSRHIGCKFTFEARNPSYGRAGTERQAKKEGDRGPENARTWPAPGRHSILTCFHLCSSMHAMKSRPAAWQVSGSDPNAAPPVYEGFYGGSLAGGSVVCAEASLLRCHTFLCASTRTQTRILTARIIRLTLIHTLHRSPSATWRRACNNVLRPASRERQRAFACCLCLPSVRSPDCKI